MTDKAWDLGILVVLAALSGRKCFTLSMSGATTPLIPAIFSASTHFRRAEFFPAACWRLHGRGVVRLETSHAALANLRCLRSRPRAWTRDRPRRLLRGGMLLRQTDAPLVGCDFHNPLANSITGTPLNMPLEPTQLFESAVELANFFFLMWLLKRRKFDGQVFGAFMFIYGIARFFLEYLRDDPGRGSVFGGAMTGTQLISIGLVLGGGLIWWLRPGSKPVPARTATATR